MTLEALTGIVAAPFLPMRQDARIDWPVLERYMDWIAAASGWRGGEPRI
jgi:hypothetical protein